MLEKGENKPVFVSVSKMLRSARKALNCLVCTEKATEAKEWYGLYSGVAIY